MDACRNANGKKLHLIDYSFMPTRLFHIERAEERYGIDGWFTLEGYGKPPENNLNYGKPVLRRFM